MDVFMLAVLNLLALLWVTGVNGDVFVKDLLTNHTIKKFSDLQASFGNDFPPDGLKGWLVYASPDPMACRPVTPPPMNSTWCTDSNCNFILLIARGGNCEFSDKVLNAERHNYAAVIVHNYIHNEDVISMGGGFSHLKWLLVFYGSAVMTFQVLAAQNAHYDAAIVHNFPGNNSSAVEMQSCTNGSLVHIPATFVGYSSGMDLWRYNYTHRRYIIRIWEDDDDLMGFPKFLWPFLLAMAVCILLALVVLLVKLLREQASKKLNRLSRKHLKKIPVRKFKKGDYYDTCAICLDEYEEGEKIRVLPCDHVYHMKCIDPWLTKNKKTCPVCKRRVIPDRSADSESESDAEISPGSENTPLLTGQTRGQSHGSVADSSVVLNPAVSDTPSTGQDVDRLVVAGDHALLQDSDIEHGAVGGEGISIRNPRNQTLLSIAKPGRGNIQEADEGRDPDNESRRKRKDRRGNEEEEEEEGISSSLLGAESRVKRKEKRKPKKDKKKQTENRPRRDDTGKEHENQAVQQADELNSSTGDLAGGGHMRSNEGGAPTDQGGVPTDERGVQMSHEEGGNVNPSYSDSHEVVVAAVSSRRDWSDVV